MEITQATTHANDLEFVYLEAGEGPLVLLLHGFPDDAWTWEHQLRTLAEHGYHAVAPFLRGYRPTQVPPDGRYDPVALADDVAGLIEALGDGPAYVVGNDWGGIATSAAIALRPGMLRRAVLINIGHPATFFSTFAHPHQVHHIFHFWFFQLGPLAVEAVRANDMAFVDYLWDYWSADGHRDREHVARVKRETLAGEGTLEAALGYYQALMSLPTTDPDTVVRLQAPAAVPTLTIFGDADPPRELSEGEHVHYTGGYRLEVVEGAGHFVHREQPEAVDRLLLDWLGAPPPARRAESRAA